MRLAIQASLLAIAVSTTALIPDARAQGQCLRFEIPAGQTASGVSSDLSKSSMAVTVGACGTTSVKVPKGATSKDIVDALVKALKAKGFKVTRNGNTAFTVTECPGKKPVQKGGGIGGSDTGVTAVDAEIVAKAAPGVKQNGGQIPKVKAKQKGARATKKGSIQVDAVVEKIVNGKKTLQHVQVVVPINPGDAAQDIEKRARKSLKKGGLEPRDVEVPSNLDTRTQLACFGLDRSQNGDPIVALRVDTALLPPEFFMPIEVFIGTTPTLGITNEGLGSQVREPWLYASDPYIGSPFDIYIQVGPQNVFGGLFLSPQRALLPIRSLGAHWLIDPLQQLLLPLPAQQNGRLGLQLPIPPDPRLQGIDLFWQGLVLDPQLRFATTDRLVVRPMRR